MQVDEERTESAAVTIGLMDQGAAPDPACHRTFIADRPFIFIIRERDYGTIRFTAIIEHPAIEK